MKFVKDIDISMKKVFVRVDFNVPMNKNLDITDDSRIKRTLPTLKYLMEQKTRIIIASHLGSPNGERVESLSLKPVADHLSSLIGKKVTFAEESVGPKTEKLINETEPGDIVFLENLRFCKEEEANDKTYAKKLANLCDIYVNDAFGICHRVNASICAITEFAPVSCAGCLLFEEIDYFSNVMKKPKRPLVAVIGGAKIDSKIKALQNMLSYVDKILIIGAIANTFLKASNVDMAASKVDDNAIGVAESIMKTAAERNIPLYLPKDFIAAEEISENAAAKLFSVSEIPKGFMALDIGPLSSDIFKKALEDAKTIIWNGTAGVFEIESFSAGTKKLAENIAYSDAFTIVGGGDTGAALSKTGLNDKISYISTGGGAFLTFLAGKTMPALKVLESR